MDGWRDGWLAKPKGKRCVFKLVHLEVNGASALLEFAILWTDWFLFLWIQIVYPLNEFEYETSGTPGERLTAHDTWPVMVPYHWSLSQLIRQPFSLPPPLSHLHRYNYHPW